MAKSIEAQAQAALNKAMDIHPAIFFAGSNPSKSISVWLVAGHAGDYAVYEECGAMHCTCPAGERGIVCYHRASVLLAKLERDAADAFNAALDASIAERERLEDEQDAAMAAIVGAWFLDYKCGKEVVQQPEPVKTYREMCFVCNHYMQFDGVGMPLCSDKCRKEHAWHNERQRKATAPMVDGFDLRNVLAFQHDDVA